MTLRATATSSGQHAALLAVLGTSLQGASGDVPVFEVGARGRISVRPALALAADVAALYQRRTSMYGTSQAFGGELSVLAQGHLGWAGGAARAGLGVRAVALRLAGLGVDAAGVRASSAGGATLGPMMRVAVSIARRHAVGELAFAGGWCRPDVVGTAGGGPPLSAGGWWAGVTVAAGRLFD